MRLLRTAATLAVVLAASPAGAQLSNHGIAAESGLASALGARGGTAAAFALVASTWLEGDVHAFARVAWASAPGTAGRAAAPALAGTVGLRLLLASGALRPQVFVDAGWARLRDGPVAASRATFGAGAALEWFPAGDVSIAPRAAARLAGGAPIVELGLAVGAYF